MKIGIFSRSYDYHDLEKVYQAMTNQGIYHTQLNLLSAGLSPLPVVISDDKIKEIRELTNRYGITIEVLSGTFNMIDPDLTKRRESIIQFETQCKIASNLNIPIVSLCTGSKNPNSKWIWDDKNLTTQAYEDLINTTKSIIKYAEKYNVILGVEVEASNVINTANFALRYLNDIDSKYLKVIMDGANLFDLNNVYKMEETLNEAFELLWDNVVIVHGKDFIVDDVVKFVPLGQGIFNYQHYLKLLRDYNYQGALIIHDVKEEDVSSAITYLNNISKE